MRTKGPFFAVPARPTNQCWRSFTKIFATPKLRRSAIHSQTDNSVTGPGNRPIKSTDMQKFKFGNPASVVEVSKSPLDRPEPGNRYTIFDCLCRGFGQNNKAPRKTYQVTATTPSAAARLAIGFYRNDFFTDGKENK